MNKEDNGLGAGEGDCPIEQLHYLGGLFLRKHGTLLHHPVKKTTTRCLGAALIRRPWWPR